MAKKITRLGDPSNPYTKKKVSADEAAQSRKMSEMTTPKKPKPAAKKSTAPKPSLLDRAKASGKKTIQDLNDRYGGGARKRAIDDAIEGRNSRKRS